MTHAQLASPTLSANDQALASADPGLLHAFADEALLLLSDIDMALWSTNQAQNAGQHLDAVNTALRFLHSIKGGAAAVGLMHVAELAHASEGVLVRSRQALREAAQASKAANLQASRRAAAHTVPVPLLLSATATLRQGLPLQGQVPRPVPLSLLKALELAAGLVSHAEAGEAQVPGLAQAYELTLSSDAGPSVARDIQALFVDLPDLGTLTPLGASPVRYLIHSCSSAQELLSLVHLHSLPQHVRLQAWSPTAAPDLGLMGAATAHSIAAQTLTSSQHAQANAMVPAAALLKPFRREAAQLAQQLGKSLDLKLLGTTIEVPPHWLPTLTPLLRHLVRNALDHGLEPPAQRVALGKAPEGQLSLEVLESPAHWLVRVVDDGKGLDRQALLKQAKALGLEVDPQGLDKQVWNLAFEPGVSTASKLSELSGRGVGLDAVRHHVQQLGGQVQLHSQAGQGCAVTLRLPKPGLAQAH